MRKIQLTRGKEALVDDADYDMLMECNWFTLKAPNTCYAVRDIRLDNGERKKMPMHKFLTGFDMTDHKDGNGLNNQRDNLREATQSTNGMNRGPTKANTSGFKGVGLYRGMWRARIKLNYKTSLLGLFTNKIDAARAYDKAARELHGEFAYQNLESS